MLFAAITLINLFVVPIAARIASGRQSGSAGGMKSQKASYIPSPNVVRPVAPQSGNEKPRPANGRWKG